MNFNPFYINPNPPAEAQMSQQGFGYNRQLNTQGTYYQGANRSGMQVPGMSMNQRHNQRMQPTASEQQPLGQMGAGGNNFGKIMGMAGMAANAYSQGVAGTEGFDIDVNAGLKGSVQGLAASGPITAIIGGIAGQIGTFSKLNKNLRDLDTSIEGGAVDAYGNPIYNGMGVSSMMGIDKELTAGDKKIKRAWDPATHLGAAIFGSRRRIRKKKEEIQNSIIGAQNSFNDANLESETASQARAAYNMAQQRLFNNPVTLPNQYNVF